MICCHFCNGFQFLHKLSPTCRTQLPCRLHWALLICYMCMNSDIALWRNWPFSIDLLSSVKIFHLILFFHLTLGTSRKVGRNGSSFFVRVKSHVRYFIFQRIFMVVERDANAMKCRRKLHSYVVMHRCARELWAVSIGAQKTIQVWPGSWMWII